MLQKEFQLTRTEAFEFFKQWEIKNRSGMCELPAITAAKTINRVASDNVAHFTVFVNNLEKKS